MITCSYLALLLLCYNYSVLYNFLFLYSEVSIGCTERRFWISGCTLPLVFGKNTLSLYKNKKKFDEAQYSYYLKILSLKMFLFCSYFVRNILMLLQYLNTTLGEFKVIYPYRTFDYITKNEFQKNELKISSNIEEVIRSVLNFLVFFTIRLHKQKKHKKEYKALKAQSIVVYIYMRLSRHFGFFSGYDFLSNVALKSISRYLRTCIST